MVDSRQCPFSETRRDGKWAGLRVRMMQDMQEVRGCGFGDFGVDPLDPMEAGHAHAVVAVVHEVFPGATYANRSPSPLSTTPPPTSIGTGAALAVVSSCCCA